MSEMSSPAPSSPLRRVPLIVVALGAIAGAVLLRDQLSFAALAENREALIAFRDANYAATALAFVAGYVVIVAFSLPGATVATLTGGFLFATFPGVIFNVTGATLGAIAIFLAARWGLGDRLAARMDASDGVVRKIKAGIDASQWEMLFLMRLVPALVGVPLYRFAVTTAIGIIPGALVYTGVGAGLGEVFARGETPDLGIVFEPRILLPMLGLCALAALPLVLKAIRGRKAL